jgi:hypothetical protein
LIAVFVSLNVIRVYIDNTLTDSSQLIPSTTRAHRPASFPFPKLNGKSEKTTSSQHAGQNVRMSLVSRQRDIIRQQSVESKANTHSDNQQFLKEIVSNILDGLGIGWLKINRVKKLMEDENYRNFVLSRLNVNLDKRYSDEDDHIEDVVRSMRILS